MTTNQYNPDDTTAATLAAFQALGSEIAGLRWAWRAQRERADECQYDAELLRKERDALQAKVDQLEQAIRKTAEDILHWTPEDVAAAELVEKAKFAAENKALYADYCDALNRARKAEGERDFWQAKFREMEDEWLGCRKMLQTEHEPTWAAVQVLMVQSGVRAVRRVYDYTWQAVTTDGCEFLADSLEGAAKVASAEWAKGVGKKVQE